MDGSFTTINTLMNDPAELAKKIYPAGMSTF